jgi:hypothetical protein
MRRITVAAFLTAFLFGVACGTTTASPPKPGEACPEENVGACASPTQLLACTNLKWRVLSDCKGPDGCRRVNETVDCDTRGNSVGDACSSPGKLRCEPDAGVSVLRCSPGGQLVVEVNCASIDAGLVCVAFDGGLKCG